MKRLRRFNENESNNIDYDYVYQCFADLLDDEKAKIRENDHYIIIDLKINQSNPETRETSRTAKIEKSKIFDYINGIKYNSELLQEVEVALNRLSEEYPEYAINFDVYSYSISINIFSLKQKKEEYPF